MNTSIKTELSHLSIEEKIILVEDLWDEIAAASKDSILLTQNQKDILDNRLENYKSNPDTAKPWEELKNKIAEKINR